MGVRGGYELASKVVYVSHSKFSGATGKIRGDDRMANGINLS
jgi:hypothetical protein